MCGYKEVLTKSHIKIRYIKNIKITASIFAKRNLKKKQQNKTRLNVLQLITINKKLHVTH